MRTFLFPLTFLITSWAAVDPAVDDAVKKELKRFQGSWATVSLFDGTKEAGPWTMDVKEDRFMIKAVDPADQFVLEGRFTINPAKKTIDVVEWKLGNNDWVKDNPILGIYEMKGDTRKSCFAFNQRPDDFRKQKGYVYLEWKKAK